MTARWIAASCVTGMPEWHQSAAGPAAAEGRDRNRPGRQSAARSVSSHSMPSGVLPISTVTTQPEQARALHRAGVAVDVHADLHAARSRPTGPAADRLSSSPAWDGIAAHGQRSAVRPVPTYECPDDRPADAAARSPSSRGQRRRLRPAGRAPLPPARASAAPAAPAGRAHRPTIRDHWWRSTQGNMIDAIKLYRERTGAGLKEAKDAVDAMARAPLTRAGTGRGRTGRRPAVDASRPGRADRAAPADATVRAPALATPVTTSRSEDATITTRPGGLLPRPAGGSRRRRSLRAAENSTLIPRPGGCAVVTAAPSNTTVISAEVRAARLASPRISRSRWSARDSSR